MSAPSPCYVTQTPQREFAGAKLQKNIDVDKFWGNNRSRKWILQGNMKKLAVKGCELLLGSI